LPLILVLTLGISSLGLALWSETLKIDPINVTTGELKVIFTDMYGGAPTSPAQVYNVYGLWVPPGWAQELPLTDDTFTFKFRNMFPGAEYNVHWLILKNVGTVPAKIQSITLENLNDPDSIKAYVEWRSCWSTLCQIIRADGTIVSIPSPTLTNWTPIEQVPGKLYTALEPYVLYPGDSLKFDAETQDPEEDCFRFRFSPNAPNESEGCAISFDMVWTWTQFNA